MKCYLCYIIKKQTIMIYLDKQPRKGDKITYQRQIMFKGFEMVTVKIVAVLNKRVLLDNGDELLFLVK